MPRNLDLTALRSFVTVAETGGVTRAAGQLNLTQSAVSMQLKRLEESLGQALLDRSGRGVQLTGQGELLLSYGRRLLSMNDELWARMTSTAYEGELTFGVPHDVVYPHIPSVLRAFAQAYPRVKVNLNSSFTRGLRAQYEAGEADVILTTEPDTAPGAECLVELDLIWFGAPGGQAWRERPLRLAFSRNCIFRSICQRALDEADIPWEPGVETDSDLTIDASLSADLAIHARLEGTSAGLVEEIDHKGALPALPRFRVNLFAPPASKNPLAQALADEVRRAYAAALPLRRVG
ncbi:MAG: LysR family transcriptional regulator [Pseudomonadota bacterium]